MLKNRNESGMTLTEIMVAIIIIGILSAIAVGGWSKYRETAITAQAESELRSVALEINDTKKRTMTPEGYKTTFAGLPKKVTANNNAALEANYDTERFWMKQFHYSDSNGKFTGKQVEIKVNNPNPKDRHEVMCVMITKKGVSTSDFVRSAVIDNTPASSKIQERTCPHPITR